MISLLFALLFTFNLYPAGFSGDTLLLTNHGQTTFETIDVNALVQSNENKFQPVLFLAKQVVEKVVHISFLDETIICHKKQLFWCVNQNDWISAEDLKIGDLLQTINGLPIVVDAAQIIIQQTEIYSLTVGPPHYLYVGKHAVLAHNVVPIVIGLSLQFAISAGAVQFVNASFCVGLAAVGACIVGHFAKNRNKKKPKMSVSVKSSSNKPPADPNDDNNNKDREKHPYGFYKGSDAHKKYQNGKKSPEPNDGQKALDNSYEVEASDQRVAVEAGKFVILKKTSEREYHGYTVEWAELEKTWKKSYKIIKALIDNKVIDASGKILT